MEKNKIRYTVANNVYCINKNIPVKAEVLCIYYQDIIPSSFFDDAYYYPSLDMVSLWIVEEIDAAAVHVVIPCTVYNIGNDIDDVVPCSKHFWYHEAIVKEHGVKFSDIDIGNLMTDYNS